MREEEETANATPAPAARADVLLPNATLGRYQLLFEIARGGMGTVYAARLEGAHGFDRAFAIKKLHGDGATESDRAAFLAEAKLTARIAHPNVVETFELGEHRDELFLVMQL